MNTTSSMLLLYTQPFYNTFRRIKTTCKVVESENHRALLSSSLCISFICKSSTELHVKTHCVSFVIVNNFSMFFLSNPEGFSHKSGVILLVLQLKFLCHLVAVESTTPYLSGKKPIIRRLR